MLTKDQLLQIAPAAKNSKLNLDALVVALNDEMAASGISTVNRKAAFLAQCAHESGGFCHTAENLNYSADGLLKTFPKYFPDEPTAAICPTGHRNPACGTFNTISRFREADLCNGKPTAGNKQWCKPSGHGLCIIRPSG